MSQQRTEAQGYGHFEMNIFGIENVVVSEHLWSTKGAYGVEATVQVSKCPKEKKSHFHTVRMSVLMERSN